MIEANVIYGLLKLHVSNFLFLDVRFRLCAMRLPQKLELPALNEEYVGGRKINLLSDI